MGELLFQHPLYKEMCARWDLIDDLLGGTLRMRAAGQKWLPREDREKPDKYAKRLARTVLFPGLEDTIDKLIAKPFSRAISVQGTLPTQLQPLLTNADGDGLSLSEFAKNAFRDGLEHGLTHILVNYSQTNGAQTYLDEKNGAVRPFFSHILAKELYSWKVKDGELVEIRFKKEVYDEVDMHPVQHVYTYTPNSYEVHRCDGDTTVLLDSGPITLGKIALVTMYFKQKGFMHARPPFEGLAWENLAHWQSSADHRNYLRFIRIGSMFAKGFSPEEVEKGIVISPYELIATTSPDADLKYVEHTGKAYDAGCKDLKMLEERMEVLGLQPLVEGSAYSTATAKAIDENSQTCLAQQWVRTLEKGVEKAFMLAAEWASVALPEEFDIDVFNDFSISVRASADANTLAEMRRTKQISHETYITEIKRRAILAESCTPAQERERLKRELELPELNQDEDDSKPLPQDGSGTSQVASQVANFGGLAS